MADQKYFIKDAILQPAPHHESFEKLWETKWKEPCSLGTYPFMFGDLSDFKPVVEAIVARGLKEPYDWDEYADMFFPEAELLTHSANRFETAGMIEDACRLYLRSSAVYRIARFPAPRSEKQREAWERGKEAFYRGAALMEYPITQQLVPHVHHIPETEGSVIPINLLIPPSASSSSKCPLLIILTGLDGYRTELAVWQRGFLDKGVATIVVEIPGTGDSPADPSDPTSPDREWSSLLGWVGTSKECEAIDAERVIVWGFSTGGYYALRMGHTHGDCHGLLGAVSLGGGAHHMFDREWLDCVDKLEYPFDLAGTLAWKFGYGRGGDANSNGGVGEEDVAKGLERFKREAKERFSLLEDGTLQTKTSCKILIVNGDCDEIFPIEDLWLSVESSGMRGVGNDVEGRVVRGKKHMGEPESFFIILEWIHGLLGLDGDVMYHMKMLRPHGRL